MVFLLLIGIVGSNGGNSNSSDKGDDISVNKKVEIVMTDLSVMNRDEIVEWCTSNKINYTIKTEYSETVPKDGVISQSIDSQEKTYEGAKLEVVLSLGEELSQEYKNALKSAESYSRTLHMSKQGIYDQLVSEYGEGFTHEEAQYAIDNIEADWNENALKKAKSYYENLSMSKDAVYDQLVSEYGEQFTAEEAQYAIDHLED